MPDLCHQIIEKDEENGHVERSGSREDPQNWLSGSGIDERSVDVEDGASLKPSRSNYLDDDEAASPCGSNMVKTSSSGAFEALPQRTKRGSFL